MITENLRDARSAVLKLFHGYHFRRYSNTYTNSVSVKTYAENWSRSPETKIRVGKKIGETIKAAHDIADEFGVELKVKTRRDPHTDQIFSLILNLS